MSTTLLPPVVPPPRRRPTDLIYGSDDRLPRATLGLLALQHLATALALVAYLLAAARSAQLNTADTQSLLSVTLVGMAIATAMQAWGGRAGAGRLLVHMPNPFMITFAAIAMQRHGMGGMATLTFVGGVVALAISPLMQRLRAVFPPTVAGVVVCFVGISLVGVSVRHALGLDADGVIDGTSLTIAGVTLGAIILCSVWGTRSVRLLALLIGIGAGVATAAMCGQMHGGAALSQTPWMALPTIHPPDFSVTSDLLIAVGLISVLSQLDTVGSVIMMEKIEDAEWRRADMRSIGRGVQANGLGDVLGSLLGGYPTAISSANIALCHATRSTARRIGLLTAALMAAIAFLPQVTLALTLIPTAVLGAVELYAAAFLIVSGIELIASRAVDSRGIFTVGLSLCAGLAVMFLPALPRHAPHSLQLLVGSGFIVAGMTAIVLNLFFRLGTARQVQRAFEPGATPIGEQVIAFVERQGGAWGARRDVVQRAAMAALEAVDVLQQDERRCLCGLRGMFDEFNFDIELLYDGPALVLPSKQGGATPPLSVDDLDDQGFDAAIEAAVTRVSNTLVRHWADRVVVGARGGEGHLLLHFDH
ncbi:uracil-xanthine permease family protein [Achromobacter aloeverae]|uniref:Xanthine/uracil permease n=1 Tax=Achromobacter aloeverae TaxID=1750518 RepID=A0A4Q1HM00_9BURK|nr:solute carrier family 23 protein [Achromobacter aloeverae]RXN91296.1 hypothetical protein C7R54_09005 [Achromobacter aloeverae]